LCRRRPPEYPVQLISYSALDLDALLRELHASQPEILVLAGRFEQEIQILRARQRWAASIQAVAAVAAGVHAFRDELGRTAEGVIGPSLWEVHASFPAGRFSGSAPDMQALCRTTTCWLLPLHSTVFTFYRGFRLDSASRRQVGHRILLIQWDQDHRVQLPA